MKKVAHFIDSDDPGGAETLIIELAKISRAYDYQFEVFHFGNKWIESNCEKHNIDSIIVPYYNLYKSIMTLPFFMFMFIIFLKKRKIDILHSHLFDTLVATTIPAYFSSTPHVGTLHDVYSIEDNTLRAYALKFSTLLGTKIVTVSKQISDHLNSLCKFSYGDIKVIKNGVDMTKFSGTPLTDIRDELNLPKDSMLLVSVGRLVAVKGFDVLIKSIKKISDATKKFNLIIVGDGPEMLKLKQLIKLESVEGYVKLIGHRDDVASILLQSDCFVLASKSEGLSCSIIEAMATSLPIVATDVGGNNELVKNNENGYLVPCDNVDELSNALINIISNNTIRLTFALCSKKIANRELSIYKTLDAYINCYEEVSLSQSCY